MSDSKNRLNLQYIHLRSNSLRNMAPPASKFFAIVAGVGAGTGRATALRFAQTYPTILLSRSPSSYNSIISEIQATGQIAHGISTDVTDPKSVAAAFEEIKNHKEFGGSRNCVAAVYNVGGRFVRKPFLELTLEDFEGGWEGNGKGLFLFTQSLLPLLLHTTTLSPPNPPTLILTGATASIKGSAGCASFAQGKFAMRAVGQSLAREFGPKGIHVAHAIIDGVIDIPRTKDFVINGGVEDGKISPEGIADGYWWLHTQPRSGFTQEIDLRPFVEKW